MLGLLWIKQIIQNNPDRLKIAACIVFGFTIIFCFLGDDHFSGISLVDKRLANVDRTFRKVFHLPPDYLDRNQPPIYKSQPKVILKPQPSTTPQPSVKLEEEDEDVSYSESEYTSDTDPILPTHSYSRDFPERDMASCHYIHGPEAGKECRDALERFVDKQTNSETEPPKKNFQYYFSYIFRRLYFSFVSASTLGYGDIYPHSWISRSLVILQIILMFIISL